MELRIWATVSSRSCFCLCIELLHLRLQRTFSSVQFSCSVVSDSLRPHESQHTRPPCPSPSPGVHSDSCPSSQGCHPAISSLVVPFFSCPQPLPPSESFPMNQLFAWGGQSTGVSALASFLPKKSQGWSLSEWTGWISLQSKGLSGDFSNTIVQKHWISCIEHLQNMSIEKENINMLVFARDWEEREMKKITAITAIKHGISFAGDENI